MKTPLPFLYRLVLAVVGGAMSLGLAHADGRAGSVEWSDGKKKEGALSLSPGKNLKLFTGGTQVTFQLDEVKEMHFKPEKEEMWEGFYFPNVGQATQVKTGEVYPIRYLLTDITLADGKVLEGHLFTTTLYIDTDEATDKVVLLAKQTGANGQKLADLAYPIAVRFDAAASASGSSQIDLTKAGLKDPRNLIAVARPDLGLLPASQVDGKSIWTVPQADPKRLLFSTEAADGVHVAWPEQDIDPVVRQTVESSVQTMLEFYDTRTTLGIFADGDDVYTLVMMKRGGATYTFTASQIPWSLVILRWKYDADEKKTTLLGRIGLKQGRVEGNSPPPVVLKDAGLLQDVSAVPPPPEGSHP